TGKKILTGVLADPSTPEILTPIQPQFYLDRSYLFSTLGLLAKQYPAITFRLLERALTQV
ncbi:MAG TPA: MutL protein, partial [Firmicutes bacterium]|nr:MutL protein [Bacillota bacterium]